MDAKASFIGVDWGTSSFRAFLLTADGRPVDQIAEDAGIKRVSKPSRRVYVKKEDIPRVRNGLGIAILTTASGVLTDKQARDKGVGGEVLCYVW